jgi:hypothetical protein
MIRSGRSRDKGDGLFHVTTFSSARIFAKEEDHDKRAEERDLCTKIVMGIQHVLQIVKTLT